jgi:hypothetical protein
MRAAFIVIALSIAGGAGHAQPASEVVKGLDDCFQLTRTADEICSAPANSATERLDCLQKARTAQLECLEHIRQGLAAGPTSKTKPDSTVSPAAPAGAAAPGQAAAVEKPAAVVPPEMPAPLVQPRTPPKPAAAAAPAGQASTVEKPATVVPPEMPAPLIQPRTPPKPAVAAAPAGQASAVEKPAAIVPPEMPAPLVQPRTPAKPAVAAAPAGQASAVEKPAAVVPPEMPAPLVQPRTLARPVDVSPRPPETTWTVGETTSPVDYSPLVTAVMRSASEVKDAPRAFVIRCRGLRTELLIRTDGTWRATRGSEVEVEYQVDNQPVVRLQWAASADGKTATYKSDAADLLRSLPEGARLKINLPDGPGAGHEATFPLAGLEAVRKKVATACKWPGPAEKLSSERH